MAVCLGTIVMKRPKDSESLQCKNDFLFTPLSTKFEPFTSHKYYWRLDFWIRTCALICIVVFIYEKYGVGPSRSILPAWDDSKESYCYLTSTQQNFWKFASYQHSKASEERTLGCQGHITRGLFRDLLQNETLNHLKCMYIPKKYI